MRARKVADAKADALERAEENIELAWLCLVDEYDIGTALMILQAMAISTAQASFADYHDPQALH